jgi:hypothetical protein
MIIVICFDVPKTNTQKKKTMKWWKLNIFSLHAHVVAITMLFWCFMFRPPSFSHFHSFSCSKSHSLNMRLKLFTFHPCFERRQKKREEIFMRRGDKNMNRHTPSNHHLIISLSTHFMQRCQNQTNPKWHKKNSSHCRHLIRKECTSYKYSIS